MIYVIFVISFCRAGAHFVEINKLIPFAIKLWIAGLLSALASLAVACFLLFKEKTIQPLFFAIIFACLGPVINKYRWSFFGYSYGRTIDRELRRKMPVVIGKVANSWTNCDTCLMDACGEERARVRELLPDVRLTQAFRGLWIGDREIGSNVEHSWVVTFCERELEWGTASASPNNEGHPPIPSVHDCFVRMEIAPRQWIFVSSRD
jgi:hypothetical protein